MWISNGSMSSGRVAHSPSLAQRKVSSSVGPPRATSTPRPDFDPITRLSAAPASRKHYPDPLRRIHFHDAEQDRFLRFLTNNFDLPALTICLLYKSRWQVELFFKWIKQHLRIKAFYGYSENAVKTQIWIAVSIYVLVAIVKKRLALESSLHEILQVLSVTLFEQVPVLQVFGELESQEKSSGISKQMNLLDL